MYDHRQESITSARRYVDYLLASNRALKLPDIPPRCVISYVNAVTDLVRNRCPHATFVLGFTNPMEVNFFPPGETEPAFAIARGLHGAPMAAVLIEELIALGFEEFLVIGPAGHPTTTIPAEMRIGELFLATGACIFEGTSPHYGRSSQVTAGAVVLDHLRGCLERLAIACREGQIATTDALYRESRTFIEGLVARQVLAVDMEMSALYTVADYYAKSVGGLVFISDVVSSAGSWELGLSGERLDLLYRRLADIVLEYMRA